MLRSAIAYNHAKIIGIVISEPKVLKHGNMVTVGIKTDDGEFHRIVAAGEWFGVASNVRKGERAYVEGALRTRKWTGRSGETHYTTEIHAEKFHFDRADERMFASDFPSPVKKVRSERPIQSGRPNVSFGYRGDSLDFPSDDWNEF